MTTRCVNVPRPEKRLATAPTSHEMRPDTAPISHSRNHSSGLSVLGHRNMMLESDNLTINHSRVILTALLRVQPGPGGTRHRRSIRAAARQLSPIAPPRPALIPPPHPATSTTT